MFLDRDGVINRVILRRGRPHSPGALKEFKYLPRVGEAIEALREAGFKVVVVTNQPDVGAGKHSRRSVEAMNKRMRGEFRLDAVKVCYHTEEDRCACRKPKPGLLREAAKECKIDLKKSFMVGDRWRDIEAGKAAGCKTVWIKSHYREKKVKGPDFTADSLWEASHWILEN